MDSGYLLQVVLSSTLLCPRAQTRDPLAGQRCPGLCRVACSQFWHILLFLFSQASLACSVGDQQFSGGTHTASAKVMSSLQDSSGFLPKTKPQAYLAKPEQFDISLT